MQDDLITAAQYYIEKGIINKNKICIMEASYGGYATLMALAQEPNIFTCGIDIVGPSNLLTFVENIPPYWKPLKAELENMIGPWNTKEDKEKLKEISPYFLAHKIKKPLVVVPGNNDARVKVQESESIVNAIKQNGGEVFYVNFINEGHGIVRFENKILLYYLIEKYLGKHLGGRYEKDDNLIKKHGYL